MVRLTRAIEFSASLRYAHPDLSAEACRERFGRLAAKHGHNYRLEVTVAGEPDPATGMVMDLAELKEILEREIMERFDHRDLNDDTPYFEKCVPTPENVALAIRRILLEVLPAGALDRIRLQPEEDTWVDVVEERRGSRAPAATGSPRPPCCASPTSRRRRTRACTGSARTPTGTGTATAWRSP